MTGLSDLGGKLLRGVLGGTFRRAHLWQDGVYQTDILGEVTKRGDKLLSYDDLPVVETNYPASLYSKYEKLELKLKPEAEALIAQKIPEPAMREFIKEKMEAENNWGIGREWARSVGHLDVYKLPRGYMAVTGPWHNSDEHDKFRYRIFNETGFAESDFVQRGDELFDSAINRRILADPFPPGYVHPDVVGKSREIQEFLRGGPALKM
jgi:hypothetical protein